MERAKIDSTIRVLIDALISIRDTTGEYLLTIGDGRVIDTKGWRGWEVSHIHCTLR